MENDLNMDIYDSSESSDGISDSDPDCTEEGEENELNLSKNGKYDDDAVDDNFMFNSKRQNIVFKLYNREVGWFEFLIVLLLYLLNISQRNGYFANNHRKKRKEYAYNKVPKRLSFCLKEIVPYCYLKG